MSLRFEGILIPFGGRTEAVEPEIGNEGIFDLLAVSFSQEANVKLYLGTEKDPPLVAEGRMTWAVGYVRTVPDPFGWTDEAPPELIVGGEDVFALLEDMNGRYVVLVVEG